MHKLRIAVVAAHSHDSWLTRWCADFTRDEAMACIPCTGLGGRIDEIASLLLRHVDAPFSAIVVLVNTDSVAWVRGALPQLAAAGGPVSLAARGLRPAVLRELLKRGARDFFAWDCPRDEMKLRLWNLCTTSAALRPAFREAVAQPRHPKLAALIGSSPLFVQQLDRLQLMASCDAGVLILGETGTGKELCAQAVHYLSARTANPWVAVNCGALPADLVEAELFGHMRGAFTSASESRVGLVAQAQAGTLFLDEVDSLPTPAQVKLLRFLQDKEYRPVGSPRAQRADVRIIAASNGNLAALCERGVFRTDLYYRLNVLTLQLPPLRERREDLMPLAQHFVERYAREFHRPMAGLSREARNCIEAYTWPGNIRELEHAIERGVLLAPANEVRAADLCLPGAMVPNAFEAFHTAKARAVEQFERRYIEHVLALCDGNVTHAADAASKNRRAFWELMRKHGIDAKKFGGLPQR